MKILTPACRADFFFMIAVHDFGKLAVIIRSHNKIHKGLLLKNFRIIKLGHTSDNADGYFLSFFE